MEELQDEDRKKKQDKGKDSLNTGDFVDKKDIESQNKDCRKGLNFTINILAYLDNQKIKNIDSKTIIYV